MAGFPEDVVEGAFVNESIATFKSCIVWTLNLDCTLNPAKMRYRAVMQEERRKRLRDASIALIAGLPHPVVLGAYLFLINTYKHTS